MKIPKSQNYANYSNYLSYEIYANCANETNYANWSNMDLRWMQHCGASGLDGWDWDGSPGGLRYRAPYGATLKKTLTAIFINNIIFEIIGPFCHVNFIYTYPIQDQLDLFQIFIIKVNSFC